MPLKKYAFRNGQRELVDMSPEEEAIAQADAATAAAEAAQEQATEYLRRRNRAIAEEFTELRDFNELLLKALDIIVDEIVAIRQSSPVTDRFVALRNKLQDINTRFPAP